MWSWALQRLHCCNVCFSIESKLPCLNLSEQISSELWCCCRCCCSTIREPKVRCINCFLSFAFVFLFISMVLYNNRKVVISIKIINFLFCSLRYFCLNLFFFPLQCLIFELSLSACLLAIFGFAQCDAQFFFLMSVTVLSFEINCVRCVFCEKCHQRLKYYTKTFYH